MTLSVAPKTSGSGRTSQLPSALWNAGRAGYLVTGHAVASTERPDANPDSRAIARATDTLIAVARSMRRVR